MPTANCQLTSLPSLSTQHFLSSLKHKNLTSKILFRPAHKVFNINSRRNSFSCLPTADCQLSSLHSALSTQHSALSFPSLSTSLPCPLPTANCQLSPQHSALKPQHLSFSPANCPLQTANYPLFPRHSALSFHSALSSVNSALSSQLYVKNNVT